MTTKDLIHVNQLCESYQVEVSFFNELHEFGLDHNTYIDMNDWDGATFKEIADQIEADYLERNQ